MSDSESITSESDREMLAELSDWESEESDDQQQRTFKERINYMNKLSYAEFTYRFRLNKSAVSDLLTEIYPDLKVTSTRNHGISPMHQLLLTLRFYALGTMLVSVADFVGVSKSSAARIVSDVSYTIAKLYPKYVYVHDNTQQDFYNIAGFPRVLGCVDGTHIHMQSPNSNIGEEFRNRKGYFSMNVQGVCDAHLRLMNVVARWPGSTHDATIFNNSTLKDVIIESLKFLAQCESGVFGSRWLIGDSAYPCKPYLLTPILNPSSQSQQRYNEAHIRTRNTVERCFGVWKRRFPILSLKIRLSLVNIQHAIIATAVLHNICRQMSIEDVEPEVDIPTFEVDSESFGHSHHGTLELDHNIDERQNLINNYFGTARNIQQ